MKRIYVSLFVALISGMPAAALADDTRAVQETQQAYLQSAVQYRAKASQLETVQISLAPTQQWVASELIHVYDRLSALNVEIVLAVTARDEAREKSLEQSYVTLKIEEQQLQESLKRSLR